MSPVMACERERSLNVYFPKYAFLRHCEELKFFFSDLEPLVQSCGHFYARNVFKKLLKAHNFVNTLNALNGHNSGLGASKQKKSQKQCPKQS